jgi:DNA-binding response OmpR family regulator
LTNVLPVFRAPMSAILVIDRDPAIRLAARRVLERAGFSVSAAADEGGAPDSEPDLIIADLAVASLAHLRRKYPAARVLALSADGCPMAGVAACLPRPFTASQLLAAVRRCLAR